MKKTATTRRRASPPKVKAKPKITQLSLWMRVATTKEQELLAKRAGTSRGMLYLVSTGHRNFSAAKAGEIEKATEAMHKSSRGRLPRLYRSDLADACAHCAYAQKCLGGLANRGEFPIVTEE